MGSRKGSGSWNDGLDDSEDELADLSDEQLKVIAEKSAPVRKVLAKVCNNFSPTIYASLLCKPMTLLSAFPDS